jgi:hypothetical protein
MPNRFARDTSVIFMKMHDLKVKSKFKGYVVGDEKMPLELMNWQNLKST